MEHSNADKVNSKDKQKLCKTGTKSPTEVQLCQNQLYEECPSSVITDTVY